MSTARKVRFLLINEDLTLLLSLFQLRELHVYLVPKEAWMGERGLAKRDVIEDCVSVGFVR